ncbi:MAG: hypothetical protein RIB52_00260 [Erythrobacter sp.]|uniref:hypothetical protein n=1 Tax=Erythrobacter sp. TaxID=1042 RepID=UPI0032EC6808
MSVNQLKKLFGLVASRYLPERPFAGLPEVNVERRITNGRNLFEGYQRRTGLEFGDLERQVMRGPIFRRVHNVAK